MRVLSSLLLLGASILSANAQTTTGPPGTAKPNNPAPSTPAPAPTTAAPAAKPPAVTTPAPAPVATTPAGPPITPLTQKHFNYPNVPYQVSPEPIGRGPQSGYNLCNATTEGPNSNCQTAFLNTIDDFCLWGSPTPAGTIGDIEAVVVAYCTKPGHGTRLIPGGALTAVQFIKTPGYIQVTGLFDQTSINLTPTDSGGELDPHGADLAGNPLGGIIFSNNLPTAGGGKTYTQVNNWSNFVGGNQFCFKACDNSITNPDYCQNIYDTQGCNFNMPAAYTPNEFTSCDGENQAPPGANPPVIPATSNCITYASSQLYSNTATSTSTPVTTAAGATTTAGSVSGSTTPTQSTSAAYGAGFSGDGFFSLMSSIVVATVAGVYIVW